MVCCVGWLVLGVGVSDGAASSGGLAPLLQQLASPSLQVRDKALAALAKQGRGVWKGVAQTLATGRTARLRLAAAFVASRLSSRPQHRPHVPWQALWTVLQKTRDVGVQRYLIEALRAWKVPPQAYYRRLQRFALRSRDAGVRLVALGGLSARRAGLRAWLAVMTTEIRARQWRRRRAAFQTMASTLKRWRKRSPKGLSGAIAPRRLLPLFRRGFQDPMLRVKAAAAVASAALGGGARSLFPQLKVMLSHRSWRIRYAGAEAFHLLGRRSLPMAAALAKGLGDGNWGVRYSSSHALAKIGLRALPWIAQALGSAQARVRLTATDTLLRMKPKTPSKQYLRLLRQRLRDSSAIIRFAAIRGLRRVARLAGDPSLQLASRDRDWRVREVALQALARLPQTKRRLRVAKARLNDRQSAVREAAVSALASWRGAEVRASLVKGLSDRDSLVRYRAAQALWRRRLSATDATALRKAFQTRHVGVKAAALGALASGGGLGRRQLSLGGFAAEERPAALAALLLWGSPSPKATMAALLKATPGQRYRRYQRLLAYMRQWFAMSRTSPRRAPIQQRGAATLRRFFQSIRGHDDLRRALLSVLRGLSKR